LRNRCANIDEMLEFSLKNVKRMAKHLFFRPYKFWLYSDMQSVECVRFKLSEDQQIFSNGTLRLNNNKYKDFDYIINPSLRELARDVLQDDYLLYENRSNIAIYDVTEIPSILRDQKLLSI
jgi:hypothetical protein